MFKEAQQYSKEPNQYSMNSIPVPRSKLAAFSRFNDRRSSPLHRIIYTKQSFFSSSFDPKNGNKRVKRELEESKTIRRTRSILCRKPSRQISHRSPCSTSRGVLPPSGIINRTGPGHAAWSFHVFHVDICSSAIESPYPILVRDSIDIGIFSSRSINPIPCLPGSFTE